MAFSEVREYRPGDDVRDIDWNVTARTHKPHIKIYEEERELTMMLVVDVSGSGVFGSADKEKRDVMTEVAAVLAFSAAQNNDKVGCLLFSDRVEKFIPPKKGRSHILQIIRTLLDFEPQSRATSLEEPLKYLTAALKKRCTTFLLSDFCNQSATKAQWEGVERSLKIASGKHDIVAVRVYDKRDAELPNVGLMEVVDAESGRRLCIDSSSHEVRTHYAQAWEEDRQRVNSLMDKARVDHTDISTEEDYVKQLIKLFARR